MSHVHASAKARKQIESYAKDVARSHDSDLTFIMSTPAGRRFVFYLIDERCGVFKPSYTGTSETYLREGRRAVGIEVMVDVQSKCSAQYVEMIKEALNLQERERLVEEGAKTLAAQTED